MENFERYQKINPKHFDTKGLRYLLWRIPSDRVLMPIINKIKNKKVLEVGPGAGYYTKRLLSVGNTVSGVDENIHLCKDLPIRCIEGNAADFASRFAEHFEVIFSAWVTEYLDSQQINNFIGQSYTALDAGGIFLSTFISTGGWGFVYIALARYIRRIRKYNYKQKLIKSLLQEAGFQEVEIIPLRSWLSIPWAFLVRAKK